jgi:predicted enzyme related to lactoylglutathione lyase
MPGPVHFEIPVLPKMAVPGVGWMAYCKDPEGHIFGIMQPDAAAA